MDPNLRKAIQETALLQQVSDALWPSSSNVTQLQSDTQILGAMASDIITLTSDIAAAEAATVVIASDLIVCASDAAAAVTGISALYSDSTAIETATVAILSDVEATEAAASATQNIVTGSGRSVVKYGNVADNAVPDAAQNAYGLMVTALGGPVWISEVLLAKDSVNMAGPTNLTLSVNTTYGKTGLSTPVASVAVSTVTANTTQKATAFAVLPLTPFILESGRSLWLAGSNAAGNSAGNLQWAVVGTTLGDNAGLT